MKKKTFLKGLCIMLSAALLTCMAPVTVFSEDLPAGRPVSTPEEFEAMAENGVYYLAGDIDFSGRNYTRHVYARSFKGTLNGNGHALLGITVAGSNSDAGIFGNHFSGRLENISFGAPDAPVTVRSTGAGYSVACVAGTVAGGASFDRVTIYANVKGDGKTAGFTSYLGSGKMTITNSRVYGSVEGNPAAGFVTMSHDGSSTVEIRNSANYARVTGGNLSAGGIYSAHAKVDSSRVCHLTVTGCVNYGSVTAADWRAGGIVGEFSEEKSSTLTVDYCYNLGTVTQTGSGGHAAGIVGGMSFDSPGGRRTVSHVYNAGQIRNTGNGNAAYAIAFANSNTTASAVSDAFYLEGTPTHNVKAERVEQADAEGITAGVLAFGKGSGDVSFIPDPIGENGGYPMLSWQYVSHDNVKEALCGRRICQDCGLVLSLPEEEHHERKDQAVAATAISDGYVRSVCNFCGDTRLILGELSPAHVDPVEGVLHLATADQLRWYASSVNLGLLSGRESVMLTADLDLKNEAFTPIASFGGLFDGNYHTVSGLSVDASENGGLFARLTNGASVTRLALEKATVVASRGNAGILAGSVEAGAMVQLRELIVNDATVRADGAAGGLVGSTDGASEVTLSAGVAAGVSLTGGIEGGLIGLGNGAILYNCHSQVTLTAGKAGHLAYHTGAFSSSYCTYVQTKAGALTDGERVTQDDAGGGRTAYLLNALSASSAFGMKEGKIVFGGDRAALIRTGAGHVFTTRNLSLPENANFGAYVYDGKLLILVRKGASERFVDVKIRLGAASTETSFRSFTLSRYVMQGKAAVVPAEGFALYVAPYRGETQITVGSFSGAPVILK